MKQRIKYNRYASEPPVLTVYEDAQYNVPQIESETHTHTQIYPGPYSNHLPPSYYPDGEINYDVYYGTRDLSWNYPKDAKRQGSVSTISGGNLSLSLLPPSPLSLKHIHTQPQQHTGTTT